MKYFFIAPVRGPINGAKYLTTKIIECFGDKDITIIDTSQAASAEDFGKFSFKKIISIFNYVKCIILKVKPKSVCYINLTPHGFAFYRDVILLQSLKLKRANITVHLHTNTLASKNKSLLKLLLNSVKVIVLNKYQLNSLSFLPNVYLLENSLPNQNSRSFEETWEMKPNFSLLFFSNISEEKGIYEAIEIYKGLKPLCPNIQLKVAGGFLDLEAKTFLEQEIKHDPNILYLGVVNEEDIKVRLFSEASVFLFLSKPFYEASPLVYIEALMFGLPIVSTSQYVTENVIKNNNGIIHTPLNLKESVRYIYSLYQDQNSHKDASYRSYLNYHSFYSFNHYIERLQIILSETLAK
ncbi:glycosyltransferase [Pontibacter akesuensis]|uniref:Glycosyltransferase involved in cell wall bisynthesis n=1 Tax=Pontibacter akesuensis TaxID=388950 RepID=A0A1I7GBV1_9BACT|nr:glycosyltransferase [Pontibacter akesuensis]GHA57627.1 hypothetical protein GCM10007389_06690 [Pontibacter akesuensis]SFU45937.1 Glycosyltransferase involved in cell wall bisynthesis [Pontibacter akesuensis]